MAEIRVDSVREATRLAKNTMIRMGKNVRMAAFGSAKQTATHVRRNMPVAFGELRRSIRVEKGGTKSKVAARVFTDAPHAAPVETGSRPHWPPLAPLVRWVKLRGMQGLTGRGGLRTKFGRTAGTTTAGHAKGVAGTLRGMESGGALGLGAPVQVARAIQVAISKRGTKPHWYMRSAVPRCREFLRTNMQTAKTKTNQESAGGGAGG
jgi:hypothetical protein